MDPFCILTRLRPVVWLHIKHLEQFQLYFYIRLHDSMVSSSEFWLIIFDAFGNSENCFLSMDQNSFELELALNYSVFHYELRNDSAKACKIVRGKLNGARDGIDNMDKIQVANLDF